MSDELESERAAHAATREALDEARRLLSIARDNAQIVEQDHVERVTAMQAQRDEAREELRRAMEALRPFAACTEADPDEMISDGPNIFASVGMNERHRIVRWGDVRRAAAVLAGAPASPSTEAAVRAGIEAAAKVAETWETPQSARIAEEIRALDAAAIAARLEGRVSREMNRTS